MKVNGYEIGDEPTREEFRIYWRVKRFIQEEYVAGWLEGEERLEPDEFVNLCSDFDDGDFSAEESDFLRYLYEQIIEERGEE